MASWREWRLPESEPPCSRPLRSRRLSSRLLRPSTGVFIYLTWMQKHFREPHLLRSGWTVETRTLGDTFHYFLYIGRKH